MKIAPSYAPILAQYIAHSPKKNAINRECRTSLIIVTSPPFSKKENLSLYRYGNPEPSLIEGATHRITSHERPATLVVEKIC